MNGVSRNQYREQTCAIALDASRASLASSNAAAVPAAHRPGLLERMQHELAAAWAACGAFEFVAFAYLGLSSALILAFAENVAHPLRLLGTHVLAACAILALCRKEAQVMHRQAPILRDGVDVADALSAEALKPESFAPQPRMERAMDAEPPSRPALAPSTDFTSSAVSETLSQRFWHFWRHWYPHLFFLFCFEELRKLVHLVQPGWQDAKLIAFDHWLTGVNPSLWLERFANPPLNELMQFAYFTYFLFLLILGAVLYHRREWRSYWAVMTYSAVGYALGYGIATIFPVQSPWFTLAGTWHADLAGGPFTALINLIEKCGRVHGAAFPSQHVAGATTALLGAWRHRRWLFWVFLPFVICMDVSTVYVRNHYVADVLAGLVTGSLGYVIGSWIVRRSEARQSVREDSVNP